MLLYRVPISVSAEGKPGEKTVTVVVSFYRRSVDATYQAMIAKRVDEGHFNEYIKMMLCYMLKSGIVSNCNFNQVSHRLLYNHIFQDHQELKM